jgi:Arc/MetJ-type ribon-helix-helix transcriptional regulator
MPKLNVTLPAKLKATIEEHVASGEYTGLDEYVCDLVRRDQQRRKRRDIEQLLLDRLDRAGAVEMDPADFKRIRRRFLNRVGHIHQK